MDTGELLKRCLRKDPVAWDIFVRHYRPIVLRGVRYKLARMDMSTCREMCDDIVQDIFLRIWETDRLTEVRNVETLRGWLAILSINAVSNHCARKEFRESRKMFSLNARLRADDPSMTLGTAIPSLQLNTERTLNANELGGILERAISELGHRYQLAVKLRIYHGKKIKDIAIIMNIPEGTAAILIKRARERLKAKLECILEC